MNKDNLDWLISTIIMLCSFGIMYLSVPCGIIVFAVAITLHPVIRKMTGIPGITKENFFGGIAAGIIILAATGYAIFLFVNKPSVHIDGKQTLIEGTSYALNGVVKNGKKIVTKEVKWSSDSGCVSVDDSGVVTANYPGVATITLVYADDKDIYDSITITVIAAAKVEAGESEVEIDQFESYNVFYEASGTGNLDLTIRSDDEDIATAELDCENAVCVTGMNPGVTVVSIEVADENKTVATAQVEVTVVNPLSAELPKKIEMLTWEEGNLPLILRGAQGETEIKIENSDDTIAKVELAEDGIAVNALSEGSTNVQILVEDEVGHKAEACSEITVRDEKAAEEESKRLEEEAEQARIEAEKKEREDFIASCKEVSYKDLLEYPDSLRNEPIMLAVDITSTEGQNCLLFTTTFLAKMEDKDISVFDKRDVKEPRILEGYKYTIYGYGNGMYTAWTIDSFLSLEGLLDTRTIPSVSIKYIEMEEE